jgi:hypothetical protein
MKAVYVVEPVSFRLQTFLEKLDIGWRGSKAIDMGPVDKR